MTVYEKRLIDGIIRRLQASNSKLQDKLKQRHPSLTEYDIQLCLYLRANLSTKEIASILNITPDSVKKAKHRLRRKLNAKPSRPIVSYFS